jgi:hypothetical protein
MSKIILTFLFVGLTANVAFTQRTSLNNHTGTWENAASWVAGTAPPTANPANITATHLNLTINGFIRRTGNVSIAGGTSAQDFIINDTLVLIGNFTFPNNAAELVVGPAGVLIVIGNVSFGNNTRVTNSGIFAVSGNATFAPGASETYDDSGGGEFFVQGNVTLNADAQTADDWDNLDTLYPVIHGFILCGGGASCVLPVKLSYFRIKTGSTAVELTWATVMEENFQKFIVQRSLNGIDYVDIGEVAGQGFNIYDIESKYIFADYHPLIGTSYYRLKAVDLDGTYEYFRVNAARFEGPKGISVYPNPSTGEIISFHTNFSPSEYDRVAVMDQFGRQIVDAGVHSLESTIHLSERLKPGVYLLRYVSGDFEKVTRFLVKD